MDIDGVMKSNKRDHSLKDIEMFFDRVIVCVLERNDDIREQRINRELNSDAYRSGSGDN